MKTNYIKTPSESDHWMTKEEQRRDFLRIAKAAVWIAVAVIMYYVMLHYTFGPMARV